MTATTLSGPDCQKVVEMMLAKVELSIDSLSALDAAVGDGDHGINLVQGLNKAVEAVNVLENPDPHEVMRVAGSTLINQMGGASGIIIGSFFRGGGRPWKTKASVASEEFVDFLKSGLAAVQKRGKAEPGDKTVVDALYPACQAAEQGLAANLSLVEIARNAAQAALEGAEKTKEMVARFGRAKFLGDRSLGHQDAGATSMALMLAAWAEHIEKE